MKCMICGRELSNPVSVARGIGPVCYSHHIAELRDLPSRFEKIPSIRGSMSFGYSWKGIMVIYFSRAGLQFE